MIARSSHISLLLFSCITLAQAGLSVQSNCWDGTFNYRVATLALDNYFVEIGLKASFNLPWETVGDAILDETGSAITNPGSSETYIFLAFSPSDCTNNDSSWHCEKTGVDIDNAVFVGRWPTRDENFQIANARVNKIKVTMERNEVAVKISKLSDSGEASASTSFALRHCSLTGRYGNTFFGHAQFPDSLKDRLRNP